MNALEALIQKAWDAPHRGRRIVIVVLAVSVLITVPVVALRGPPVAQPVAFNHLKHTSELGLECVFCHVYVGQGAHAGLPGAETCSICHGVAQGTSPEAARVTKLLESGDPLRFNKLFRMPEHVFYTHRRHVEIAKLECVNCHGTIAETTRPPERPLVKVTMAFCIDCHREQNQTTDCNACHR
ncbi:MAG TPA: cytochrome c3 family protein [Gemmatimonadales bacterium]|jgi:hypothetical protein